MPSKPRDVRIDVIRVVSICLILLHHSDDYGFEFLRVTPTLARLDDVLLAWMPLAVFFALSGYLAVRHEHGVLESGPAHLGRRFGRLYVPFAIALVCLKLLSVFTLDWTSVGLNLALLGPWTGKAVGTLWFVEILLVYHGLYALWLSLRPLATRPWTLPVVAASALSIASALAVAVGGIPDQRLVVYLPAFLIGVSLRLPRSGESGWSLALSIVMTLVSALGLHVMHLWVGLQTDASAAAGFSSLALVATLALWRAESVRQLSLPLVGDLARSSYFAYLLHRFVFRAAANLSAPLGVLGVSVAVLVSIPLVLAGGMLLQHLMDAWSHTRSLPA